MQGLLIDSVDDEAWSDWVQHRADIKKPIKAGTVTERKNRRILEGLSLSDQRKVVDYSIERGYVGLFVDILKRNERDQIGFIEKHTDTRWRDGLQ